MSSWWWLPAHVHVVRHGVDVVVPVRLDVHVVVEHVDGPIAEHAVVPARLVIPIAERVADEAGPLIRTEAFALRQRGHVVGVPHGRLVQPESLAGFSRTFCGYQLI